ncbi:hypothetical protein JOM56_000359 [Amanita muscaria]
MADTAPADLHIRFRTPSRVFGIQEPSMDDSTSPTSRMSRLLNRLSFSSVKSGRARSMDSQKTAMTGRLPIPTMLPPSVEVRATPLPTLPMIVLCITVLGEFLCANVSTPFILFMVKGFGQFDDEAQIGFWTGILVSAFFLTQFLTSLLWATIAEKHGRRTVLVASLLGSAITCVTFGTCTSLHQAMTVRLLQGIFAGAVGVARGSVPFVTDASNEGRAYAILGFCWGMGGVSGAIVGGAFETPAAKWPQIFGGIQIFVTYPYLLPCSIAAIITLTGSLLACFLGRDGGLREGAIHLPPEKDSLPSPIPEEDSNPGTPPFDERSPLLQRPGVAESIRTISRKLSSLSNYLPGLREPDHPSVPLSPSISQTPRASSRVSRADGSAYGYSGNHRPRLTSRNNSFALNRRPSMASSLRWRGTGDAMDSSQDLNFAQKLLMANENAVNNIADLWVAAAMNVDNEDPFESGDEAEEITEENDPSLDQRGRRTSRKQSMMSITQQPPRSARPSRGQFSAARYHSSPVAPIRHPSVAFSITSALTTRRSSTPVPTIFSHSGVETPRAVLDAQDLLYRSEAGPGFPDTLRPIMESRQPSDGITSSDMEALTSKPPSLISQLPISVIIQYGMLALHSTTHDQVFMSYILSDYADGGLELNAGYFARLIAMMCLAQIAYQFYIYPNLGPPRGKFSHLSMYRLGSVMFIPAYLFVIHLRPFVMPASTESGGVVVSFGLILATALRYCGITFTYTSISILLNYMTPPEALGYANGIAQSIVSLARCFGPTLGGYLWSISVKDEPSNFYFAFCACAGVAAICALHSLTIR